MISNILATVFFCTTVLSLVAWYLAYRSSSIARKGIKDLYEGTTKMQSLVDDAMASSGKAMYMAGYYDCAVGKDADLNITIDQALKRNYSSIESKYPLTPSSKIWYTLGWIDASINNEFNPDKTPEQVDQTLMCLSAASGLSELAAVTSAKDTADDIIKWMEGNKGKSND